MISVGKGVLLVATAGLAIAGVRVSLTKKAEPDVLSLIKGYRSWTKANAKPVRLATSLDALCRGIMPDEMDKLRTKNPHFSRMITVYTNKIGEEAMAKGGTFPEGSVIVKEKSNSYAGETSGVVMSTVMIKRKKGYNPACGDWEFAAVDAAATKTNGVGKLENCMKCHAEKSKNNYVFRTYIGAKDFDPSGWQPGINDLTPLLPAGKAPAAL